MTRIKSVLVGVDAYERPDIPRLNGCVNDVALVRRVLKEFFGSPNEDIRIVVNERATKANILHRLRVAIRDAEPGDIVVFYFSGHGSQIRDRDGDELTDLLDEVLCPYDMDWERGTYILDDELDTIFAELPEGILLEVFLDCCFFGAVPSELAAEPRAQALRADLRYLAPPLDIAARTEGDEYRLAHHGFFECSCFAGQNVLWTASEEGQLSAEDFLEGRAHGVFTYWGCRFIEANIERIFHRAYSREALLEDLRTYMHSLGYAQSAGLAAPHPLRAVGPLMRDSAWEAWLEAGGRAFARPRTRKRGSRTR